MNKSQFLYELKKLVAWDEEPQLDDDDLDLIFSQSRVKDRGGYNVERTQVWEPNTYYDVGDVIVPTSFGIYDVNRPDEHSYIVTSAGTSGATEPTWDLTVSDGSAAWERHEAAYWTPTYNLDYAAYLGWRQKAAKAASRITFTSEGATFQREQYIANCLTMQRMYAARLNYSVRC
jgi:hypothetical protein